MFGIKPCLQGEHSKTLLLETNLKLNSTFNEHALTIHGSVFRKTDN